MIWDPEKIPVWLRRTPEQQAADQALQARLKQAYGPGVHPSPTERHLMRADMVERSAKAHLEHLSTVDAPDHQLYTAKGQLAEAWAMKGQFREAAELHPSKEHSDHFNAIADAIERDDSESCECIPETVRHPVDGKVITLDPTHIEQMVFSGKHRRLMPVVKCPCGFRNVTHAPAHVQRRIDNLKTK